MRKFGTTGALIALAAAALLTALLFGSVSAAHAAPMNRTQAVRMAKDYLRTGGFSYTGLVGQLKYEGFSTRDARYGAGHAGANWMKEAVQAARSYLRSQAFSFRGMVEQLRYEGFTRAQAVHGARAVGL